MKTPPANRISPAFQDWLGLLLPLRKHLDIAHHIRGRLRLRLALGGLAAIPPGMAARLQAQDQWGPAIRSVRVNLAALSVVIEYDSARIPQDWWPSLLRASEDEARQLVARIEF